MREGAQVKSVEALESLRANLIVYLSKARPTLEEASDEVRRTRGWLETDQRCHWEGELRRRAASLQEAQQELFSAKLSNEGLPTAAQQLAVSRAQSDVREAEDKLRLVRKWRREFESLADPLAKQLDQVHGFLTTEMPRAVVYLTQAVRTLEAYAEAPAPTQADTPGKPADPSAPSGSERAGAPPPGEQTIGPQPSAI